MNIPRIKFTIRRLMIAVAILSVFLQGGLWVAEMRRLSGIYDEKADEFTIRTIRRGSWIRGDDGRMIDYYDDENARMEDTYALIMAEKYWHLSAYPWLPVEPDPPPPALLAEPLTAYDLPPRDQKLKRIGGRSNKPPAWTFLWTWRRH